MNDEISHLYKITNKLSNEYYIGKHYGISQKKRNGDNYWGSGSDITQQIKLYGKENFTYEVLCIGKTDFIFNIESRYVTKDLLESDIYCLNKVPGGKQPPSQKGVVPSEETLQKLKGRIPWNKGKSFSEETRKKQSEKALGRKHSQETIEKFKGRIPWNKNKKGFIMHSDEFKNNAKERLKGNTINIDKVWLNDGQNEFTIHKDIVDEKIKEGFLLGRLKRMWITNGSINKSILKGKIPDELIEQGFALGRTFK